jgi:hypothetical protein
LPLLRSFSAFVPEPKNRTRPAEPLPEPKGYDLPHFEAISQTPLPQLPFVVQIGFAWLPRLSGWQRQSQNLPQYASKQAPRQVALSQQQPVVAGMLYQSPAGLHQPLLQAGQRPRFDSLRQHQPPPQIRDLTENRLRRGVFKDPEQLIMAIGNYIDGHNQNPKPFIWTAKAIDILEKVTRAHAVLNSSPE